MTGVHPGQVREHVERLSGDQVMADTDTAFGWLADHAISTDRMGVIGFDLGGSVALLGAGGNGTLGMATEVRVVGEEDQCFRTSGRWSPLPACCWPG